MPDGLTLNTSGMIEGTPNALGTANLAVQVQDSASHTATRPFSMRIVHKLRVTTQFVPGATPGSTYRQAVSAFGGTPPYAWAMQTGGGPLPPGITIDNSGILSGTIPSNATPGSYNFNLSVTDSGSPADTAFGFFTLQIVDRLTVMYGSLPFGVVSQSYGESVWAAGGQPPLTWSVPPGSLPTGLNLNSATGDITGSPTAAGSFPLTVQVTDSASPPQTAFGFVSLQIRPLLAIVNTTLPDGVQGTSANVTIHIEGGRPPFSLRVSSGSLPPGLSLYARDPLGGHFDFNGMSTQLGVFAFTLEATDSSSPPGIATQSLSMRINTRLVITNNVTFLPEGLEATPYTYTYQVSGGIPPYTWYCPYSLCALQAGLTFDLSTGSIRGTPTEAGIVTIHPVVVDSSNPPQTAPVYGTLHIIGLLRTTSHLPPLAVGVPARLQLATIGGTPPFRWSLVSGNLPAGLTLDTATGEIKGTPTSVESPTFTVRLADSGTTFPQSADQTLTLSVVARPGRNDSIATATPLSNGTYRASISPFADPPTGAANPDNDFYAITANPGAIVTIETTAQRLTPPSPVDSVIEILDSTGTRHATCSAYTWGPFSSPCLNDDNVFNSTVDSKLIFKVPGTPGTPVSFYVRVLDWRGDARPDLIYDITISGAN